MKSIQRSAARRQYKKLQAMLAVRAYFIYT
jgi:hypothetical protein